MLSSKKLLLYVSIAIISLTQTIFAMEIPLTHRIVIGQMSHEDPSWLGRQSPNNVFWTEGFPTNRDILEIAIQQREEKLISNHMEQLGLYQRITTITECVREEPNISFPYLTHTTREVVNTTTNGSLISGRTQEYAQWIYNTYKQRIFQLARQRIAQEEKIAQENAIKRHKQYLADMEWQAKKKAEKEVEREANKRIKEELERIKYEYQYKLKESPAYIQEKSNYDYAKKQHDSKCLVNKILDELYFVQNNKWAQACEKNNKIYKTRRTPEQIKAEDSFNLKEPKNPNDPNQRLHWDLENTHKPLPYYSEIKENCKAPKKPQVQKKELKFAYLDFDKIYEYVEIDLLEKINFVIQEYSKYNSNSIFTITDNSILDLNNKQFDLKNITKEVLLKELHTLKKNLLAREHQDKTEAYNEFQYFKEKVNKENAYIKANHAAFLEQLETESENYRFERGCQEVMRNIMQYNEAELIKAFLHMRSSKTTFEFLSPLKDGKDIKNFNTIEQHAFKNYFPECNSLKILREQAHLLAMIKYAPCYVQVICKPDQLPIIEPIDTFSNEQDSYKFMAWYQALKDKPWDVDSTNYIERFIEVYCNESDSFFDSFKYHITNTLFSYKQLNVLVKESNNELACKVQSHLSKNQKKLDDKQQLMNFAHVFTKDYELFYSKSQSSDLTASLSSKEKRNNFFNYPTSQQLTLASQQKFENDGIIEYEQCDSVGLPKKLHILKYHHEKNPLGEEFKALWNSFLEFVKTKVGHKKDTIIDNIHQHVTDQHDYLIQQHAKGIITNEDNTITKSSTTQQALQWTSHGYKHVAPKNIPWKKIVTGTTHGDAVYKPEINIKELELYAWENGKKTTNGKNWKVFKFDNIIGANSGKETYCVRVECSANTIHGHPISEKDYRELLK